MAISNAIPASLRKPVESIRFAGSLVNAGTKPYLVASLSPRAATQLKTRFVRLPQEPEDARITGVTRSLNRRLLGLNLGGSLMRREFSA